MMPPRPELEMFVFRRRTVVVNKPLLAKVGTATPQIEVNNLRDYHVVA